MPESDFRRTVLGATLRGDTSEKRLEANEKGELLVAGGLPRYTEMARLGGGFSVMATAAIAGLVVRPSTVAAVTLWNGETDTGKSYIIDRIFTHQLVSGTAQSYFGIWVCVHPTGMTAPTADITAFKGNTGKTYNGRAVCDVGATVVDDGWFPWGNSGEVEEVGVLPGAQIDVRVEGRLIVPPSAGISIHVVAGTTDEDFCSGLSWYETELDIQ